jgi:hypothetical protein
MTYVALNHFEFNNQFNFIAITLYANKERGLISGAVGNFFCVCPRRTPKFNEY